MPDIESKPILDFIDKHAYMKGNNFSEGYFRALQAIRRMIEIQVKK